MPKRSKVVTAPTPGAQPSLQPQAAPVDTFHQSLAMPPAQGNDALDLAQALANFHPSLQRYADVKVDDYIKEGEQAALLQGKREANRAGLKQAVDSGQMPAGANPWFQKGWRRQQQRVLAEEYATGLQAAYEQSDAKNNKDPAYLSAWIQGHTKEFVDLHGNAQDPEFADVFMPMVESAQANLASQHGANVVKQIEQEVEENTDKEISLLLDDGQLPPKPIEVSAQQIQETLADHVKNGMSGTKANLLLAKAVGRKAEETLNPDLWEVVDRVSTGNGMVGQIGDVKDLRADSLARIYSGIEKRDRQAAKDQKDEQERVSAQMKTGAYRKIIANPTADVESERLACLKVGDTEGAAKIRELQTSEFEFSQKILSPDEKVKASELTANVYKGVASEDDIISAYTSNLIDRSRADKLLEDLPQAKEFRSAFKTQEVSERADALFSIIWGDENGDDETRRLFAAEARGQFYDTMADFIKSPEAKKPGAVRDKANEEYDKLLKRFAAETAQAGSKELSKSNTALIDAKRAELVRLKQEHQLNPEGSELSRRAGAANKTVSEYLKSEAQKLK